MYDECAENGFCNCEAPKQVAVWPEEGEAFYNCPIAFVSDSVLEWWNQYKYEREYGSKIEFGERNSRFVEALSSYNHYLQYWTEIKEPPKPSGMESLKQSWLKK